MEIGPASSLLSPIVAEIIKEIKSSLKKKLSKTLNGKLRDLSRKMEAIHSELLLVERSATHLPNDLQQQIREVTFDVEYLLDDLEIEELRRTRWQVLKFFLLNLPDHNMIGDIKEKLGDLNKTLLKLIAKPVADEEWTQQTWSVFPGEDFIGRKVEKDKILEFLLSENNKDNNTYSIVGIGGMGKTALAQVICQHEEVKKKLVVKWAHVGFKEFKLEKILILIGVKMEENNTLEMRRSILEESLGEKTRYLFVLDDLWDISPDKWQELKSILLNINKGNKILITTRNQRIAEIAAKDKTVFLNPLEPGECLPLIKKYSDKIDLLSSPSRAKIIAECEGVPMAALTLGVKLSEDELSEKKIIDSDIWSTEDVGKKGNIMNSLKLSYDYLPPNLQKCFAYHVVCNGILHKERLTQMWTAQGFIEEPDVDASFEKLKNASLFYDVTEDIFTGTQFKVLNLFRTLIFLVSKEYADTTISEITGVPSSTRHVSLSPQRHAQEVQESRLLGQLRTVVGLPEIRLLLQFKCLRVLVLFDVEFESKDISFSNLKHLRYLDLSKNGNLEVLPESLGELLLLRTLRVDMCDKLKALLPNEINKLKNLRYLYASSLQASLEFKGLGSLQTLHLKKFENLKKLPKMSYFTKLETLEIIDCPFLRFQDDDMKDLTSLKRLAIINLPRLKTVPLGLISSGQKLNSMRLSNCENLTNLPEGFRSLTSLERLTIEDCPRFELSSTVDGRNILPRSLKLLRINRCDELTKRCESEEGRDDVSLIKEVYLNGVLINPVPNVEPSPSSSSGEGMESASAISGQETENFDRVRKRDKDKVIDPVNKDETEGSRKQTQAHTRIKEKTGSRIVKLGEAVGIEERKKNIEDFFLEESEDKLYTLFIGGIMDAENDTVQSMCKDVQDKFEIFKAHVPGEEFNLTRIVRCILDEEEQGKTLEQLRIQLQKKLQGKKRFLIRLDVYGMNAYQYDKLEVLLRKNGKVGNKLLITTRGKQVHPPIPHKKIKNFSNGSEILKLSFETLRPHIKMCFLYSTCFTLQPPERGRLTQQWIAHDLIEGSENNRNLEDLAREYFDELLSRSFFYNLVEDDLMAEARFEVHDLVYKLAHKMSEGDESENLPSLRKLKELTYKWENFGPFSTTSDTKLDMDSLTRSLRVLDLSGSEFEELPSSIGELRDLRYIDVSCNIYLDELPNSLFELSNLETLRFEECGIQELPRDFSKLKKLRNLYACTEQVSFPEEVIRDLASLRILHLNPIHNLETLPKSLENLTALETLVLRFCSRLTLLDTDMKGLKSLQNLTITHSKKSSLIPSSLKDDAAASLSSLCLSYCLGMATLPEWLVNLQCLRRLHVEFCPNLAPSPSSKEKIPLPNCLAYLSIRGCPELTKIFEREDWQQENKDIREIRLDGRIIRSISDTRSSHATSPSSVHVEKDNRDKGKITYVESSKLPSSSSRLIEEIYEGEAMIQSTPYKSSIPSSSSSEDLIMFDVEDQALEFPDLIMFDVDEPSIL